jgi:hypothetical protein
MIRNANAPTAIVPRRMIANVPRVPVIVNRVFSQNGLLAVAVLPIVNAQLNPRLNPRLNPQLNNMYITHKNM